MERTGARVRGGVGGRLFFKVSQSGWRVGGGAPFVRVGARGEDGVGVLKTMSFLSYDVQSRRFKCRPAA